MKFDKTGNIRLCPINYLYSTEACVEETEYEYLQIKKIWKNMKNKEKYENKSSNENDEYSFSRRY